MNIKIPIHQRNIEVRINSIKDWKISEEDKKDLLKFIDDLELGKVNKGRKISKSRQLKYLDILKPALIFFNKPTSKLIMKDIENFEKALTTGKIKSQKKKEYSLNSQSDIKKSLKIYLKWKGLDNELTDWLDTRVPIKTPDYLSEQEIIKLYKACKTNEERYLIVVLFDGGMRAEEFFNIRKEDLQLPDGNENYVRLTLKDEYSKTKGRVISLYWKNSLEAIRDYYNERIKEGLELNEQIFKLKYDNVRQFLNRFGKKILNKSTHFHLYRHSSATYYASKLNRQQLCYRYGWAFSSRMPDVYISRAGMENKELDEKFNATDLEDIKKQLEKEKQESSLLIEEQSESIKSARETIEEQNQSIKGIMKGYNQIKNENKSIAIVLRRLIKEKKIAIKIE